MALTPVQWENEQQTPRGGEDKLTLFMNVLEGSFTDASFFNFKNMTTLFTITVLIFPHTRLSNTGIKELLYLKVLPLGDGWL